MNILIFSGRIVSDPELISISNINICNFRIAARKKFKKKEFQFLLCTAYGNIALAVHKYAKKGLRISVTGYLTLQEYEEGNQKKIIAKCIIEEFEMIDFPEREEMLF